MLHDKKNKKFLKTVILAGAILAVFLFGAEVLAQADLGLEAVGEATGLSSQDIRITIARILRNAFALLGIITVGIFVYAGYLYMTAGGDAGKVETARAWMKNAVIGIVIMLSAFGIAQFILSMLMGAVYGDRGGIIDGVPFDPLSGSLGRGIVQTHYPGRNETGIPRNTMISITFKEAIIIEDIIEDTNENGIHGDEEDLINSENIIISRSAERDDGQFLTEVFGRVTEDHRTFVFAPREYLGSPAEDTWYTVSIASDVRLEEDESPAFAGAFVDGYMWEFEVGTFLDLTPPQVESVVPRSGTHPRNIIIQINFDESIDPTSASGELIVEDGGAVVRGFRNIEVRAGEDILAGKFSIGNGYRSVEFTTNDLCGINSCGGEVYCLPGNADINVRVRAASLGVEPPASSGFPYDGIVDMVGNSLDGNDDNEASGPPDDNFEWAFYTSNRIDLTPPTIERIMPDINEGSVELDAPVNITFDKVMSATTLNTSNVGILTEPNYPLWYDTRSVNLDDADEPVGREDDPAKTRLELNHAVFAPSTEEIRFDFFPVVSSGVKDVMQNCYFPGAGFSEDRGACDATPSAPYCCNGDPSEEPCDFLPL